MKSLYLALAAAMAIACPHNANAQSAGRAVAVGGAGRDTCSAWSADRGATSDSSKMANERRAEWALGFFSAVNLFLVPSGNLKGGIDDQEGMLRGIDKYCETHPGDPLWTAGANLFLDLKNHPRP